ncbi:hypothetical protein HW555_006535 [Spodoptera exigua]|uniref:DDE Tnp4 domain-containing protein n=1 Tax=Spodoptera exigua TaxID=7107 RepID=A0A835L6D7_SPOEX|nr:hypothetical protein HW555_006535 [Spodoptera exigua]
MYTMDSEIAAMDSGLSHITEKASRQEVKSNDAKPRCIWLRLRLVRETKVWMTKHSLETGTNFTPTDILVTKEQEEVMLGFRRIFGFKNVIGIHIDCTHIKIKKVGEEEYNKSHILTRNTIERCFGVWKQRFRCLLHGFSVSLENAKLYIVALAVLHNFATKMGEKLEIVENIPHVPRQPLQNMPEDRTGHTARQLFIRTHF